ncbi:divergent polysaccharide deacetylase family protein [Acidimangrovimonas sediminis]|uniref:divergent polysaccharide deacetylase family protein n=1 Tax=Acidimangrovimonas sediminis TaxID=2056283 RepID=UPI000C7F949D|nr:divergent polysaccharide deacetylase family protein [Acidimangrovimonas sediminis]
MAKGVVSGALAGVVVSVLGLGALSEFGPPPGRRLSPAATLRPAPVLPATVPSAPAPAETTTATPEPSPQPSPEESSGASSGTSTTPSKTPAPETSTATAEPAPELTTAPAQDQAKSAEAPAATSQPETAAEGADMPSQTGSDAQAAGTTPPETAPDAATAPAPAPEADTAAVASVAPGTDAAEARLPSSSTPPVAAAGGSQQPPRTPAAEAAPVGAAGTPAPVPQVAQAGSVRAPAPDGTETSQITAPSAEAPLTGLPPAAPATPSKAGDSPEILTPPPAVSAGATAPGAPAMAEADAPPRGPAPGSPADRPILAAPSGPIAAQPGQPAPEVSDGLPKADGPQPRILKIGRDAGTEDAPATADTPDAAAPLPGTASGPPSVAGAPKPGFGQRVAGVTMGRLPTISENARPSGQAGETGVQTAPAPSAVVPAPGRRIVLPPGAATQATPAPVAPQAAVRRYASDFSNPDSKPVLSVILIDTGGTLDRAALAALPLHITFAIDPTRPGAAEAAQLYRAAGHEVLILADGIPANATATDLATIFEGYRAALPEAVGVLDPAEGGWEADRPLSQSVVDEIRDRGLGLVTYGKGLDAAAQIAQAADVPAARIYRRLDADDENPEKITRYLDRAAFKAAQDGRVVVIGHTRPDTVTGLKDWAGDVRARTLAIGPVTAALKP